MTGKINYLSSTCCFRFMSLLLCIGILLPSCANHTISGPRRSEKYLEKINRNIRKKSVKVFLTNGDSLSIENLTVAADSISFIEPSSGFRKHLATRDVRQISFKHRNVARGLFGGILAGGAFGGLIGLLGGTDCSGVDDGFCFEKDDLAILGASVLGTGFGFLGLIGGAAVKTTTAYQLESEEK